MIYTRKDLHGLVFSVHNGTGRHYVIQDDSLIETPDLYVHDEQKMIYVGPVEGVLENLNSGTWILVKKNTQEET